MPTTDRQFAAAKLTRSLRVLGRRPDGYHLIEAEMVSLDFGDVLELCEIEREESRLEIVDEVAWTPPGEVNALRIPSDETNLVRQALHLCGRRADVVLRKRIPAGGGLGGGSSDAAAVLRWADRAELALAVELGADVPFCLAGGRAMARGVGEELEELEPLEGAVVLVMPPVVCETGAVYRAWDDLGGPQGEWGNDLEEPAASYEPRLDWWRTFLYAEAGVRPRLAGSGSTWFFEVESAGAADELASALAAAVEEVGQRAMIRACGMTARIPGMGPVVG